MRFLLRRLFRRFTLFGRLADLFLLAGIALRFANRRGWVSDDVMGAVGLDGAGKGGSKGGGANKAASNGSGLRGSLSGNKENKGRAPIGEVAIGAGALWRLLRRRAVRRLIGRR